MARLTQNLKILVALVIIAGFGGTSVMTLLDFQAWGVVLSHFTLALIVLVVAIRSVSDTRYIRKHVNQLQRQLTKPNSQAPSSKKDSGTSTNDPANNQLTHVQSALNRLERTTASHDLELQRLSNQLSQAVASLAAESKNNIRTQREILRERELDPDIASRLDRIQQTGELVHSFVADSSGYRGNDVVSRVVQQLESLIGIYALAQPRLTFPPSRGWAASPDFLAAMLNEILARETRPNVFECGAGLSTLVAAYALKRRSDGGHLFSLEHDPQHAEQVGRNLRLHGLPAVDLTVAPLSWVDLPFETDDADTVQQALWYDTSVFTLPARVDLLIVDGPPGRSAPDARYPALPILRQRLSADAVVLLDDAQRTPEKEIAQRWAEELQPCTLEWLKTEKGTAVLRLNHNG